MDKWTKRYLHDRFGYDEKSLGQMISEAEGSEDFTYLSSAIKELTDSPYKDLIYHKLLRRYE